MGFLGRLFGRKRQIVQIIDSRSDEDREIEREAKAGLSLGPEADSLLAELIQIGQSNGFLTVPPSWSECARCGSKVVKEGRIRKCTSCGVEQNYDDFDKDHKNIRAQEIGERLSEIGGLRLMRVVWWRVRVALGPGGGDRELDVTWNAIIDSNGNIWLG